MTQAWQDWTRFGWNAWSLGIEAAEVMTLRTIQFASGGDRDGREARRMVAEKLDMAAELGLLAMTGGLAPHAATKRLRGKVRANRRRLRRA